MANTVNTQLPVHPDDLLFFNEVATVMRKVAKQYELPLRSIKGFPMPASGMADRLGDCDGRGDIRLVLRCTVNGEWCENPMSPQEVWDTAAHELAHLRHLNHGDDFMEFWDEMKEAIKNHTQNHTDKILRKLVKLKAQAQSEAKIGNAEAAETFAAMVNSMMLKYELSSLDVEYARVQAEDPVVEIKVDFGVYKIRPQKTRIAWQEQLASIVAKSHLCAWFLRPRSNDIWFAGTKSHATVAEYVYGTLVPIVDKLADKEYYDYLAMVQRRDGSSKAAHGYRPSWISAFIHRLDERFEEAKRKTIVEECGEGNTKTGLMRLEGAMVKVRRYCDDKFAGRPTAASVHGKSTFHAAGHADGRKAADSIAIGRKGVNPSNVKGHLS